MTHAPIRFDTPIVRAATTGGDDHPRSAPRRARAMGIAALGALALAGCVAPQPRRPVAPRPAPAAPAPALAPPTPQPGDWRDIPQTPGSWAYAKDGAGSTATFTETGGSADFTIRCDPAARRVTLTRPGATGALTITTSYSTDRWPAGPVTLAATDRILDRIAFSRGRFTVESVGTTRLVLPVWAEPARVVEDCRA